MIDFHCHLDLYSDGAQVLDEVVNRGIHVLAVTTTPNAWHGTCNFVKRAALVKVALGLHPELVAERSQEVDLLCKLLPKALYVGEIGIDGSERNRDSFSLQQSVFEAILKACAANGGRIMSIHSRGAAAAVLDAIENHPSAGIPVLHWFSGTLRELNRAIRLGCWFSIGTTMLCSKKGKQLAEAMPADRILTETDGPFARKGTRPLMPWEISDATRILAEMWHVDSENVESSVFNNFQKLLSAKDTQIGCVQKSTSQGIF